MNDNKHLSQDEMIKNLLRDYSDEALEFFNPEIYTRYGKPIKTTVIIQEIKKHRHFDPNLKHDLAVIYEFANKKNVVLPLFEHWSQKEKFDIHRLAHYLIDLDYQYPDYEKFPVVIFTDDAEEWKTDIQREIVIKCLDEVYLSFRYKLVRLKEYEAEKYINTKNRFVAVLRSAMKYDKTKKALLMVDFLRTYGKLESDIKKIDKNAIIIEYFLKLTETEKEKVIILLKEGGDNMTIIEMLKNEYKIEGIKEGEEKGKIEAARKMLQKGYSIDDVIEITELSREDLITAGLVSK